MGFDIKRKIFILILIMMFALGCLSNTATKNVINYKTNKEILKILIVEILDNSFDKIDNYNNIYLLKKKEEPDIYIENVISSYLKKKKKDVFYSEDINQIKKEGLFFEFNPQKLNIRYEKGKNRNIKRNILFELFIKLTNIKTKEIIESNYYEKEFTDFIDESFMQHLFETEDPYLMGTVKSKKGLKDILEPVLVILSSTVIVYLLYSIRSR